MPWQEPDESNPTKDIRTHADIQVTDAICEWDYGDYEGLTSAQIREQRAERGEGPWDIWRDGCPGGESPADVSKRLDELIDDIRTRFHGPTVGKAKKDVGPHDVLIVAHGHILRAFAARWIARDVSDNPALILEAGGVGTLSITLLTTARSFERPDPDHRDGCDCSKGIGVGGGSGVVQHVQNGSGVDVGGGGRCERGVTRGAAAASRAAGDAEEGPNVEESMLGGGRMEEEETVRLCWWWCW
ncbi:putative phosphoglycerate mutase family protein [Diplodia seriata]|uniref:Putative phosphoglycerate mutase family protein n=1 Tax=Diplodia seriata TaxID=420778 RepID=A0A0G2EJR7_9PEZI|nr:putative phosphoglycerate mutase family protein [Diplodia seriata]